jgi:N-acetylneuraminic acid mutarotase
MDASKLLPLFLCVCLATGCKVKITVPEGGEVDSLSGTYSCDTGQTCEVEVVDEFFNETFRARPDPGYRFTAWLKKDGSFCGGQAGHCKLDTSPMAGTSLMSFLESDDTYFLEPVFGLQNSWAPKPDMPLGGVGMASCAIRGKLYVIGSGWGTAAAGITRVDEYDPASNTWRRRADMPTSRGWVTAAAAKNKCYVIGGSPPFAEPAAAVEEYDPKTNKWRPRASLPEGRVSASAVSFKNKIYVLGGAKQTAWLGTPYAPVRIYDPETNQWSKGADMPTPRQGIGAAVVEGWIYAVGGSDENMERYNPVQDKWETRASLPVKRHFATAAALGDKLFIMGGLVDSGGSTSPFVYRYDPQIDKWLKRADMANSRYGRASQVVNGQIYALGGREFRESAPTTDVETYTP